MTSTTPTVLAVGAAGPSAGLVVPELARRGARVRGFIRDAKQGDAVRENGAAEVAVGDLTDRGSVEAALEGVDSVFYIAPAFMNDEAEVGRNMVDAAMRAGVRRFVFSSVIHPTLNELDNHAAKVPVEDAILNSGMEYALLHPTLFMQIMAWGLPKALQTGTYAEPWSAETHFSRVDYREVAEVAAIALTEDRLTYGTYELCAEGTLNRHDVAALMSEVTGKTIQAGTGVPGGAPPPASEGGAGTGPQASGMQKMVDWYNRHGLLGNALTLRAILGREPRTLRVYLEELVAESRSDE